ncbi:PHB depolymerase family esterase [Pigmentiphaga aceris]|uniref:PHB depolymerase family esterase n=1 Tax=Pigmentiphaga aceris TaxID=1940612 RepID=A0A5C0AYK1_9BURK|nr:PHB depolymerase family esterase [Pigmentiphaga aceris]QEI06684.1 PHB depolymerase family esterase [Pigmentiphaga aceris]
MARKLSTLFFSMAQRMARDQQRVLRRATRTAAAVSGRTLARTVKNTTDPLIRKAFKTGLTAVTTPPSVAKRRAAAAAPIPGAGTWQAHIFRGSTSIGQWHGRLAYHLYIPSSAPAKGPHGMPLVVMLHGCQQTAADFARGTRMNRLADKEGFVIAWPQQSANAQSQRCWRWFRPQHGHGGSEADAIASLARSLVAKLRLDADRVYVAGLSAGAGMAALVALRHPDVFAAVGLHSGAVMGDAYDASAGMAAMRRGSRRDVLEQARSLLSTAVPFAGMPAMIVHGGRDHVVDVRNARQLFEQFRDLNGIDAMQPPVVAALAAGTDRAWQREDLRAGRRTMVRLAYVPALGHAWSGGDSDVKFHDAAGPNAGLLFWRFFEANTRVGDSTLV